MKKRGKSLQIPGNPGHSLSFISRIKAFFLFFSLFFLINVAELSSDLKAWFGDTVKKRRLNLADLHSLVFPLLSDSI